MKQVEVIILGQSYLLACPEDGEALLQAAVAMVDREMGAIRDAGRVKARERIAVLAALNLAYRIAETPRTPPAAADAAAAPASAAAETDTATAGAMHALVAQLIDRVDTTLSEDGRLL